MLVKQSVRTLKVWASDQFWVSKFGVMVKRCSQAGLPFSLSPTGHTTTRVRGRRGGHCTPDHNCNKQVKLHHTSRPPTEPTNMCRKLQSQEVSGLMQGVSLAAKTFLTNWGSRKEGFLRFKDYLSHSLIHSPIASSRASWKSNSEASVPFWLHALHKSSFLISWEGSQVAAKCLGQPPSLHMTVLTESISAAVERKSD